MFIKIVLWLLLFVVCSPLAILLLIVYPIVWLLSIPFRLIGISVEAVLSLIRSLLLLPSRVFRG
jgi:hypothetical protein